MGSLGFKLGNSVAISVLCKGHSGSAWRGAGRGSYHFPAKVTVACARVEAVEMETFKRCSGGKMDGWVTDGM